MDATGPGEPGEHSERLKALVLRVQGALLLSIMGLALLKGLGGVTGLEPLAFALMLPFGALVAFNGTRVARVFLAAAALAVVALLTLVETPGPVFGEAVRRSLLFVSFFSAILILREATFRSDLLRRLSDYLVSQPPGRRFISLLLGSHLFGVMMNMGGIVLLGAVATQKSRRDGTGLSPFDQRQAALAVLRGFAPTAMWSPLSLTPVVVSSLVPGVRIGQLVAWGIGFAAAILAMSFVVNRLETWTERRKRQATMTAAAAAPARPPTPWRTLFAVLGVVLLIFVLIAAGVRLTGAGVATVVTLVLPVFTLGWLLVQCRYSLRACVRGPLANVAARTLPAQSSEITVMMVAAFVGPVIVAVLPAGAIADWLAAHPPHPIVLVYGSFLIVLVSGAIAVNPIVTIAVIMGLIGDPRDLGVHPLYIATTLTAAWGMAAQLSPVTACSMISAGAFGVTPRTLVFGWNRTFGVVAMLAALVVIVGVGLLQQG